MAVDVLEYVLDGLEKALELERELGVRTIDIDRQLLRSSAVVAGSGASGISRGSSVASVSSAASVASDSRGSSVAGASSAAGASADARSDSPRSHRADVPRCRVAFVHDRPLSGKGVEMMANVITALKLSPEQALIVVEPPMPDAAIYVFLGAQALRRYLPDRRLGENCWGKTPLGKDMVLVKSPEEILRFETITPAVTKLKQDMWRSLKAVRQRLNMM